MKVGIYKSQRRKEGKSPQSPMKKEKKDIHKAQNSHFQK